MEVRPGTRFGPAHGVAYEIAAHEDECRAERLRHSTKAAKDAWSTCLRYLQCDCSRRANAPQARNDPYSSSLHRPIVQPSAALRWLRANSRLWRAPDFGTRLLSLRRVHQGQDSRLSERAPSSRVRALPLVRGAAARLRPATGPWHGDLRVVQRILGRRCGFRGSHKCAAMSR